MALVVYNTTGTPIALAGTTIVVPASAAPPTAGESVNVTSELRPSLAVDPARGIAGGLSAGVYTTIAAQVGLTFTWTGFAEYSTGDLVIGTPGGAQVINGKTVIATTPVVLGTGVNAPELHAGDVDPSAGAGVAAPRGSDYRRRSSGVIYRKTGVGNTDWEELGAGGGSSSITLPPVVVSLDEDETVAGNVLANATTTSGTLSIMSYTITGHVGVLQAGETVVVPGLGTFSLATNGAYEYIPPSNFNGAGPVVVFQATNGSEIRISTLTPTVGAVNDPPVASDAYALSFSGEDVDIDLSGFVTDVDADSVTLTHLNGNTVQLNVPVAITGGTYTFLGGTTVRVNPDNVDVDPLEFTYTVFDGALSDTGNVTVQVGVENTPLFSPIAPVLGNPIDQAAVHFGKTYRQKYGPLDDNGVNVSVPPYSAGQGHFVLTDREPWLYNRATTLWLLAKRTQDPVILAEAMTLAQTYMAGVQLAGNGLATFNIIGGTGGDPTDVKYLYADVAWWYEKEILAAGGTTQQAQVYRSKAQGLYRQTLLSFTNTYDGGTAELWTERNAWCAIMNCLAWYWISGSQTALDDATAYVEDVLLLSATGAPLHSKDKHESDGDPTLIISPWMTSLLAEAMLQYHRTTDSVGLSKSIPEWLSDLGDWLLTRGFYTATGAEEPEYADIAGLRIAPYLVGTNVQFPEGESADVEHCVDVAELMRKVKWAKETLALSTVAVDAVITELEAAGVVNQLYWTRNTAGYPRYRVNPSRKYGWWYRCRYSAVHSVGIVPFPPTLTTAPVVTGSTQSGSQLSCSTGVWAGTPAPTYTYQWRRGGSNIVGQTANTYTTGGADEGTNVDCMVTATNTGGSAFADSNDIAVVPAGSPEITVQPTGQSAVAGATAEFSAECTATPTATYQWQVSTNGGGAWNNVAEGTGGSGTGNTTTYTTEVLDGADDGDLYRVRFTNAGGQVTSDEVPLAMIVQQEAVRFADNTTGASLTVTLGAAGFTGWTVAGWFYLENVVNSRNWCSVQGVAGRTAYLQYDNNGTPSVGDSQTGTAGGSWGANPPPTGAWIFMTFRGPAAHPGTFVATWQAEAGGTVYTATRANGIENSVTVLTTLLNGNGLGDGHTCRAQYVRGWTTRLTDQQCEDERMNNDPTGTAFYNVFEDNGGGGVAVRDASGNNNVFTLDTGTLSAQGPLAPTVA